MCHPLHVQYMSTILHLNSPYCQMNEVLIVCIHKSSCTLTKILQIIMWNIGMVQKAKETRSGCLVHIVSDIRHCNSQPKRTNDTSPMLSQRHTAEVVVYIRTCS